MSSKVVILDCYTDEPSGLGVPPYLGTYPRYLFGKLSAEGQEPAYITIDDLRLAMKRGGKSQDIDKSLKTDNTVYNLTKNSKQVYRLLDDAKLLVVILGVHVPGKYLTAVPGTLKEIIPMMKSIRCRKILTGPAVFGSQLFGGRRSEDPSGLFDEIDSNLFNVNDYSVVANSAVSGAALVNQLGYDVIGEIELGRGCDIGKCSFCLEPVKNRLCFREPHDILSEIKALYENGARHFRLGKVTCFYSYAGGDSKKIVSLLKNIRESCPEIETLHIDNVNPNRVVADCREGAPITKAIIRFCTPGNVAAFGVESFDSVVVRENCLNTAPSTALKAIELLNFYGATRGGNGMPLFLPGINLIFGLAAESRDTHKKNMLWLNKILEKNFMVRRINIRQVAVFPGTKMDDVGMKFIRKNKKYYWKWRNEIRHSIDLPLLERLVPIGTVLSDVYAECYDGKTTFCRQKGTYPLVVGIRSRVPLHKRMDVKVKSHMLRSIVAEEVISK